MAIANGTCVSFCSQPKAQFGYLRRVTPVCRCLHPFCGWRHLATQIWHILASPGYAPGTIAANVTWMEIGFNACQKHRSMYLSIFNRFPVIQPLSSKVRHLAHFCTFILGFGLPYAPGTIAVNVICAHLSSTVYDSYSEILSRIL